METVNTGLTSGICSQDLASETLDSALVWVLWSRSQGGATPLYLHAGGLEDCIEGSQAMKIGLASGNHDLYGLVEYSRM